MANTRSAFKRIEIGERNRIRNKAYKSTVRTLMKKSLVALLNRDNKSLNTNDLKNLISLTYSKIDKAVQKGIIHSNNGNAKKALLAKYLRQNS